MKKKKFHVGEYVRISPHLRRMYPNYWLSLNMLKYAGMVARVEKLSHGEVYLDISKKLDGISGYMWHPALLESIERIIDDGDDL